MTHGWGSFLYVCLFSRGEGSKRLYLLVLFQIMCPLSNIHCKYFSVCSEKASSMFKMPMSSHFITDHSFPLVLNNEWTRIWPIFMSLVLTILEINWVEFCRKKFIFLKNKGRVGKQTWPRHFSYAYKRKNTMLMFGTNAGTIYAGWFLIPQNSWRGVSLCVKGR